MTDTSLYFNLRARDQATGEIIRVARRVDGQLQDMRGRFVSESDLIESRWRLLGGRLPNLLMGGFPGPLAGLVPMLGGVGGAAGAAFAGGLAVVGLGVLTTFAASAAQILAAGGVLGVGVMLAAGRQQVKDAGKGLVDEFKRAFEPLADIVEGPVAAALGKFASLARPIAAALQPVLERLAPTIPMIADGLVGLVSAALPGFQALASAGVGFFEQLGSVLPGIGAGLGDLMATMATAQPLAADFFLGALAAAPVILRGVAAGMAWLMKAFEDFQVGLSGFSVNESFGFFDGLGFGIKKAGDAIQGFRTGLSGFTENEVATPFERAGLAVRGLTNGLKGVTENEVPTTFERIGMAVRSAADFFARLSGAVNPASQALQALVRGDSAGASAAMERFRPIIDGVMSLVDAVRGGASQIKTAFDAAMTPERIAAISGLWEQVKTKLNELVAWLQPKMDQVFQIIGDVFKLISIVVGAEMAAVAAAIGPTLDWIQRFWGKHGDDITAMARGAWQIISSVIGGALDIIQGVIRTVTAVIQGDWSGAADGLRQVWDGLWTIVAGIAQGAWAILSGGFRIFSGVMDFIGRKIADGVRWAFGQAKDWAVGKMGELQDWMSGLPGRLLNAIGDIGAKFKELGGNIIDGIKQGIKDAASRLYTAARDAVDGAKDAAKRALSINSPSRVFRDQVGKPIAEGMAVGIEDGGAAVARAASDALPSPVVGGGGARGSTAGEPIRIEVSDSDIGRWLVQVLARAVQSSGRPLDVQLASA